MFWWASCPLAFGAVDFDGVDDSVLTAVSAPFQIAVRTVSAWIYPRTAGESNFGIIVSTHESGANGGWLISMCSNDGTECPAISNTIEIFNYFTGTDGAWYATTGVTLNAWNHVAVSYDASSTSNVPVIYINGQLMTIGGPTFGTPTGSSEHSSGDVLRIGTFNTAEDFNFDGLIDDVRIYNRALSAVEIEIIAKGRLKYDSLTTPGNGLVGYWPLDDSPDGTSGDGDTFVDRSGNGNNGTGVDGANNTGLTAKASSYLMYPVPVQ